MKRFDYYAASQPWKMPKWMSLSIGSAFAAVGIMTLAMIAHLSRSQEPVAAPVVAAAPSAVDSEMEFDPDEIEASEIDAAPRARTRALGQHHAKARKVRRVARQRGVVSRDRAAAILAKRNTRSTRRDRDELDRLLGM